ncbi:phosphotransferase family protein [Mycolicibacterium thermoresistibile]
MTGPAPELPGLNQAALTRWLSEHVPTVTPPISFSLVAGGRSNLTYRLTDANGQRWVLRRPPLGHESGTAHNVLREAFVLSAFADTDVPVPRVDARCDDPGVTGAPFYLMAFVDGFPLETAADAERIAIECRRDAGFAMIDALAAIHRVEVDKTDLHTLARPGSYVQRQLRRWRAQFHAVTARSVPLIDEVADRLAARAPAHEHRGFVHGDFRSGNLLFDPAGRVHAVLDWELSAVGDVNADLGWLMASWTSDTAMWWKPAPGDGFPTAEELLTRYREASGRAVPDVRYYESFALWRLACIAEGVYARFSGDAMAGQELDVDALGRRVLNLVEAADRALDA